MITLTMKRVTITVPDDIVHEIDRRESNRSKFLLEAARRELEARRRDELERSLRNAHPESGAVAEAGVAEWGRKRDAHDDDLVDRSSGRPVRWSPYRGWEETGE